MRRWQLALVLAALLSAGWALFLGQWAQKPKRSAAPEPARLAAKSPPGEASKLPAALPSTNGREPGPAGYSEGRELAMVREAYDLNRTDKPSALALMLDAERLFGDVGHLVEARRALLVSLLADTARMAEARDRARSFMELYPSSRYLPLVQGVTGLHPRPTPSETAARTRNQD